MYIIDCNCIHYSNTYDVTYKLPKTEEFMIHQ